MTTTSCCAECGAEGGAVSLKACKSCMLVKYCNAKCQKKHWATHKKKCKRRAAEIHDEALVKNPPPKEDCPICFLPMPSKLLSCISLPPATILSVPIYDLATANVELADEDTEEYYPCCGKSICRGCIYSFCAAGNMKCPFCNSERMGITDEEDNENNMRRVEANDAASIYMLANFYQHRLNGLQQDEERAMELFTRAADLGNKKAHSKLADIYKEGGCSKKAKFHFEAAAMAGDEVAQCNLGLMEAQSRNIERAVKHWTIAASAGHYKAMQELKTLFEKGFVSRESINSTLEAYNNSCAEFRSEARDTYICAMIDTI